MTEIVNFMHKFDHQSFQHALESGESVCEAAALATAFWDVIAETKNDNEEMVATLLIVAPSFYDDNFVKK